MWNYTERGILHQKKWQNQVETFIRSLIVIILMTAQKTKDEEEVYLARAIDNLYDIALYKLTCNTDTDIWNTHAHTRN